jgi:hypothetical protein
MARPLTLQCPHTSTWLRFVLTGTMLVAGSVSPAAAQVTGQQGWSRAECPQRFDEDERH